jgi:multidrug resistance protein, MATE family
MQTPTVPKKPHDSSISLPKLFGYFLPELVTATLLYIGLEIIDFSMIACTNVASCNATLVISNSLFHLITKVAEGFMVALVIMCGQYNGAHEYHRTGKVLSDAFWTTALIGGILSLIIFLSPYAIYSFYGVPQEIVELGVPFIRIRSLGVFFSFMYLALIGFLRGIKNTKAPMTFFIIGAVVFLFFDYALIFGKFGFPALGIRGSAIATVAQYGTMLIAALVYILLNPAHDKYGINLFTPLKWTNMRDLVHLSWPVMIDKATIAIYPIWLTKMLGVTAKAASLATGRVLFDSYAVLRVMERVGILPAVAFAQVITFLVSNDYKISHFTIIKKNIKKVLFISACLVGFSTMLFCIWPQFFLGLLNKRNAYNEFIAHSLWYVSILIFFDVLQLILSAALRGAADVQTVMWARIVATGLFFVPVAYGISLLPLDNLLIKFVLLYSSVHLSYALMGSIYVIRFKSGEWKRQSIKA